MQRVGSIRHALQQLPAAETAFRQAVGQSTVLVDQYPDRPEFRLEIAFGRIKLATLYRRSGRTNEAAREAGRVNDELPKLRAASSTDATHRKRLAEVLGELSDELSFEHRLPEADAAARAGFEIWESLAKDFPSEIDYRFGLAQAYSAQGTNLLAQRGGQTEAGKAEAALRQAEARLTSLRKERPGDIRIRSNLRETLTNLGVILNWTKRHAEAEGINRRALTLQEGLAAEFPDVPDAQQSLAIALNNLGSTLADQGRNLESEEYYGKALEVSRRLAGRHPDVLEYQEKYVCSLTKLGNCLSRQEKHEEARRLRAQAVLRARDFLKAYPEQLPAKRYLVDTSFRLAETLVELGDRAGAARATEDLPWDDLFDDPKLFTPGVQADVYLTAAQLLVDCAALAERDASLTSAERAEAARAHAVRAKSWLEEAARRGVDESGVLCRLAELLSTTPVAGARDPNMALKMARRALETANTPSAAGLAWQVLGWAQYRGGDWKGCIEALEKCNYHRDGDYFAAMAHWHLGDQAKALALLHQHDLFLVGYEKGWIENKQRGQVFHPTPAMMRRIRTEAAALLGVVDPPNDADEGRPTEAGVDPR